MKGSPFSLSLLAKLLHHCVAKREKPVYALLSLLLLLLLLQRGNEFEGEYEDLMFVSNPMMNMMLQEGLGLNSSVIAAYFYKRIYPNLLAKRYNHC
jgi:hypothetical protein